MTAQQLTNTILQPIGRAGTDTRSVSAWRETVETTETAETAEIAGDVLEALAADINRRLRSGTVRVGATHNALDAISTGFEALDAATGIGGLPRGRITELIGRPTSGRETIAARAATAMTRGGTSAAAGHGSPAGCAEHAAWIDVSGAFDAAYLAACGADLERLHILRPPRPLDALAMADRLVRCGRFGLIVLDALPDIDASGSAGTVGSAVARFLRVVTPRLGRTPTVLLVLAAPELPHRALAHGAALRISLAQAGFLRRGGVFRGWRTRARILKSPGTQGAEAGIEIWLG